MTRLTREIPSDPLPSHDLAAFVRSVELGSIHGAAEALALTQSAVTKRVQALERRLGVALLERGRFGVLPTEAGRALYLPARRALRMLADAEGSVRVEVEDEARLLRIAASHTIGEFLLPRWLSDFARPPGSVHPHVAVVHSPGVVAAVRAGEAEIGFVEFDESADDLETLALLGDEIVAVVAPDHRWALRETLAAAELEDEPFLTRERGSGTRSVALGRLSAKGIVLRPAYEASSTEGLKRAVLSGGFTLISRLTVDHEERLGTLHVLRIEDVDLRRELRAVRDRAGAGGTAAARFWDWLERQVATGAGVVASSSASRSQ